MTKEDVIRILRASNVTQDNYSLLSGHKDFAYNLVQEGINFSVFWMENGLKSYIGGINGQFTSFEDAAKVFLEAIEEDFPLKRD